MRIDLHQHLWPDSLVEAMRKRAEPPCLDGDTVRVIHEKPFHLDLEPQRVDVRIAALDEVGIDRAVVSLSTPVGIEALPAKDSVPLLDAYHSGVADAVASSRGRLAAFAAVPLDLPDAGASQVAELVNSGFAGASIASEALASERGLDRCRDVLDALAEAGAPLFVHPGPAPWTPPYGEEPDVVWWWRNLAVYPGLMLRAFFTWRMVGAARHPGLKVVFTIMAGGAPFLEERYRTFSGEPGEIDPNVFFDAASCRRNSLDIAFATYGLEQIVYGTDYPVIPGAELLRTLEEIGEPVVEAVLERNPARVFGWEEGGER
jgi:predicted TIM-barrel fold metal-dependent hydrolase